MKLCVDLVAERVYLGPTMLEGQWVDFYALLMARRAEGTESEAYVSADALARVGPWRHKDGKSIGKEVARHLNKLAGSGLKDVVEHRGRTKSWRLATHVEAVVVHPDAGALHAWLEARSLIEADEHDYVNGLQVLVDTMMDLSAGRAEAALADLDRRPEGAPAVEPALAAWTALLRGRATFQRDDDEDDGPLFELCQAWSRRVDAPGRAVGARLRALLAMRHRFENPSATLASLAKLAADLELRGDIGSLAAVLNVMGLLSRRAGTPQVSASYHLRAVALFGIAGDHPSLQAALFNLALSRREALALEGLPPDDDVLSLVDLCLQVCACFGVGGDSAQAEISGAQWACERRQFSRARRYLEGAEQLVARLDSTFEQACFLEVRAEIDLAHPREAGTPLRDLRTSEALFSRVGDEAAAARVRRRLRAAEG